jgi:hypothetical protein
VPCALASQREKAKSKNKKPKVVFLGQLFFQATQLFLTGGQVRQPLTGDRAQKSRRAPGHTNVPRVSPPFYQRVAIPTNDECSKIALSGECEYVPSDASIVCQQPPNKLKNTLTSGTQMTYRRYPLCESVTGEPATMIWRKNSAETRSTKADIWQTIGMISFLCTTCNHA